MGKRAQRNWLLVWLALAVLLTIAVGWGVLRTVGPLSRRNGEPDRVVKTDSNLDDGTKDGTRNNSVTKDAQDNAAVARKKKQDFDLLLASATAALAEKKYDQALKDADEALTLFPNDASALGVKTNAQAAELRTRQGQLYKNSVDMKFAWIEPGKFLMGSPETEVQRSVAETPHPVTLTKGYRLGTTLVTQWQWEQVLGNDANHSAFMGKDEDEMKQMPVDNVSWFDCVEFCNTLSEKEKRKPCYRLTNVQRENKGVGITSADVELLRDGTGYRLPTEAEWEYAARAGTTTAFWWGDTITPEQANYDGTHTYGPDGEKGEYRRKTTSVELFPPNPWKLHDMGGNLWQWCEDYYRPYDENDNKDPVGVTNDKEDARVLRGGSWVEDPQLCRVAYRFHFAPGRRAVSFGVRVVLRLD